MSATSAFDNIFLGSKLGGDGSLPVGFRGKAPVDDLGGRGLPEAEAF